MILKPLKNLFNIILNILLKFTNDEEKELFYICLVAPWCSGYHYCTTSTKLEPRFCAGSNPVHDMSDLWQWSRLEIRLNTYRRSTIPQKQFIIINYLYMSSSEEYAEETPSPKKYFSNAFEKSKLREVNMNTYYIYGTFSSWETDENILIYVSNQMFCC